MQSEVLQYHSHYLKDALSCGLTHITLLNEAETNLQDSDFYLPISDEDTEVKVSLSKDWHLVRGRAKFHTQICPTLGPKLLTTTLTSFYLALCQFSVNTGCLGLLSNADGQ